MSMRLDDSLRANYGSDLQIDDSWKMGSDLLQGLGDRVMKGIQAAEAKPGGSQAIDPIEIKNYMSDLGANVPGLKFSAFV